MINIRVCLKYTREKKEDTQLSVIPTAYGLGTDVYIVMAKRDGGRDQRRCHATG